VDISVLKQAFKTRGNPEVVNLNMTEGEITEEFLDCLEAFTWVTRGVNSTSLSKKEFIDF